MLAQAFLLYQWSSQPWFDLELTQLQKHVWKSDETWSDMLNWLSIMTPRLEMDPAPSSCNSITDSYCLVPSHSNWVLPAFILCPRTNMLETRNKALYSGLTLQTQCTLTKPTTANKHTHSSNHFSSRRYMWGMCRQIGGKSNMRRAGCSVKPTCKILGEVRDFTHIANQPGSCMHSISASDDQSS